MRDGIVGARSKLLLGSCALGEMELGSKVARLECRSVVYCLFFFFFQAEDGIRDYKVTGVQTCALPIAGDWQSVIEVSKATCNLSSAPRYTRVIFATYSGDFSRPSIFSDATPNRTNS